MKILSVTENVFLWREISSSESQQYLSCYWLDFDPTFCTKRYIMSKAWPWIVFKILVQTYLGWMKFCPKNMWSTKNKDPKKLNPKRLVKIQSVTAEILLIWTNVARTYMLPGQISPWKLAHAKDCPTNLLSKFGPNRFSNSWDIPDMDKCRQDKSCMDKCHCDWWYMF